MTTLTITITIDEEENEITDVMQTVRQQISDGFTSGYYPTWNLVRDDEDDIIIDGVTVATVTHHDISQGVK